MNYQMIYTQTHDIVTRYRAELEEVWPTPNQLDCLKFAVMEAAEVLDADKRINNPEYVRNNDKNLDPLEEVADCLMMLVSANYNYEWIAQGDLNSYDYMVLSLNHHVSSLAIYHYLSAGETPYSDSNKRFAVFNANKAITICIDLLGEDAPNRVEQRLIRIRDKVTK